MAFPAGVALRTVQVGPDILNNGSNVTGSVTITLYEQVIWTATHASILTAPKTYPLTAGGMATFQLPNTSQAGFVDTAGDAITGWLYKISYNLYAITEANEPADMLFTVPAGGGTLYLNDLIDTAPPADPVRIGIQPVLTVNSVGPDGTGNVVVAGGVGGASDLASIDDMSALARTFNAHTTAVQMRGDLGIVDPSGFMATVLDDTTAGAALTTLGLSTFVKTLMDDADASAFLTTLGLSTFFKTLVDDADASTVLSTLGFSAYAKTLIDDTTAAAARTTLGSTATGDAVFVASTAAVARTALGATSTGSSVFVAADAAAGRTAIAAAAQSSLDTTNATVATKVDPHGTPVLLIWDGTSAWTDGTWTTNGTNRPATTRPIIYDGGPSAPPLDGTTGGGGGMASIDRWWAT